MAIVRSIDSSAVKAISDDEINSLRASLRGGVFLEGSAEYDEARLIWNAMVDRKPGMVIRARGASDIRNAVNFAREHGLLMSVRSGGHQIAGHSVADGAVMLDLSHMRSVHIDPAAKVARIEPGALLGDIDREAQAHALALPVGVNSITGIAGLTLGGGFGWLTRKHGMTIDNMISADLVTADGSFVRASATENPDLFWAIRGGGGNFGVVTSFEFRLHDVGPHVLAGPIVFPMANAHAILKQFDALMKSAPDELTVWVVIRKATPAPFLPQEWVGRPVLIFSTCYAGDMAEGARVIDKLRALGTPVADEVKPTLWTKWQTAHDAGLVPGFRNYWKSQDLDEISDGAISAFVDSIESAPDADCEVFLAQVGGAMARIPDEATAYPHRAAHFIMNVHARWEVAAQDEICIAWARKFIDDMADYAVGSLYVNFMPEDDVTRVSGAYGEHMDRLREIKTKYDPQNLFRLNHNIAPNTG
jgi:FAD/FMN-containing dehydrogenase